MADLPSRVGPEDEPVWLGQVREGSWLRVKDEEGLRATKARLERFTLTEQGIRLYAGCQAQVARMMSYHGGYSLIGFYGLTGLWLPEYLEPWQLEPEQINYEWSRHLADHFAGKEEGINGSQAP